MPDNSQNQVPKEEPQVTKEQIDKQARNPFTADEVAAIKEQLKRELVQEFKDEQTLKREEAKQRREAQEVEHKAYIEKMKASPDPWVEVIGMTETDKGVKTELEWNDAFVDYLRANGVTGTDQDQVVQKWITLLLRDMADQMEERYSGDYE